MISPLRQNKINTLSLEQGSLQGFTILLNKTLYISRPKG